MRMIAIVLIVLGILGLAYGGFTYTQSSHDANVGPIHVSLQEKKTVPIPVWAGAGAIVLGGLLLMMRDRS
jgi:hypothetical protein